jgi:putative membrane protein insertion efficiency factor
VTPETASPPTAAAGRRSRPRRRRWWVAGLLAALLAADLARPPADQASAAALLAAIHLYQATLSPLMPRLGVGCRFTPTCSRYAEGAVRRDGALVGTARAVWRIARCGPWTPAGTHDPP